ncbi:MAG: DUF4136 domain-containing protein [Pseudomonadota bacterium]
MKALVAMIAALFLVACASDPFTVTSDYDRDIDYSGYQTYAWVSDSPMVVSEGSTVQPSPLLEQRFMDGIERELAARGFAKTDNPAEAQFVVGFTVGVRDRIDVDTYPTPVGFNTWNYPYGGWNYGYAWGGGSVVYAEQTRATQYTEGTLAIDIFDVESRRPVWHGKAQGVVKERDPQEERDIQTQAIQEILATFPPL